MKYGVILMRAQPVHKGHLDVIEQALSENDKVLIVLGSANKEKTKRNPLPAGYRESFLINSLTSRMINRTQIMKLPDWSMEDAALYAKEWGYFFYYNVVKEIGTKTFTFYYNDNPETVKSWFTKEIAERITIKCTTRERDVSGTKIRESIECEDDEYLKEMLPETVFTKRDVIKKFIEQATEDDFMMK